MAATARTPGSRPWEAEQEGTEASHGEAEEADPAKVVAPAAQERNKLLHQHRLGVAAVGAGVPPRVSAVHRSDREGRAAGVEVPLEGLVGRQVLQQGGVAAAESVQKYCHGQFGLRAAGRQFGCGQRPMAGDAGAESRDERACAGPDCQRAGGAGGAVRVAGWRGRRGLGRRDAVCAGGERGRAKADSCQLKQPAPGQGRLVHSSIIGLARTLRRFDWWRRCRCLWRRRRRHRCLGHMVLACQESGQFGDGAHQGRREDDG